MKKNGCQGGPLTSWQEDNSQEQLSFKEKKMKKMKTVMMIESR